MPLVGSGVRVEHDHATVEVAVGNEELIRFGIYEEPGRPAEVLRVVTPAIFSCVADLEQQFPLGRELQNMVVFLRASTLQI